MSNKIKEDNEPTPQSLADTPLPDPVTPGEREAYLSKIEEQQEEIESLKAEIIQLKGKPIFLEIPEKAKTPPRSIDAGFESWIPKIF